MNNSMYCEWGFDYSNNDYETCQGFLSLQYGMSVEDLKKYYGFEYCPYCGRLIREKE